jgi:hypothetical protein
MQSDDEDCCEDCFSFDYHCECCDCKQMEKEAEGARTIQALARGGLTRRTVHFALLSADPDALARIM